MNEFDRGDLPRHFRAVREQHANWLKAARPPTPRRAPRRFWAECKEGRPAEVLNLTDETVTIKDYGRPARSP